MLEDKHDDIVPFDNTFHRQLADVRNSAVSQNHPDVELLRNEHQKNLRHARVRSVLDSLTGIPALDAESLTQPTVEQRVCQVKQRLELEHSAVLRSFAEMTELIQTTSNAGQLTLGVIAFPELLKVRIGLGEEALKRMKLSLSERILELINLNGCMVGDYADHRLIVLLPAVAKSKADALLKQVQMRLSEEYAYYSHARIRTYAHVGTAVSEPGHNWQELLAKADLAVGSNTKKSNARGTGVLGWLQGFFFRR